MLLLIAVGNYLVMLGGWFECLLMYNGSSLGFLYGLCFALIMSKVTSKIFTTFNFTSAVIFRSNCSKILCRSFLHSKKSFSYFKKKTTCFKNYFLENKNFFTSENSEKYFLTEKIFLKIFLKIRKNIFLF